LHGLSGRVRAKTGTLDHVSNISGVVTSVNRHTYVFSIMCNGITPAQIADAHTFEDAIVTRLAHGVVP
jgi:D-alanyl-D-alanine carboxypeptidase